MEKNVIEKLFDKEYKPLTYFKHKWAKKYWEDIMDKYSNSEFKSVQVLLKLRGIKNVYPQFETEIRLACFIILATKDNENWVWCDSFTKIMNNVELRERTDIDAINEVYNDFEKDLIELEECEEENNLIVC